MSLQDTPNANRIHITLFGKRNSGKSSLINAIIGQEVSVVSDTPGTTTDPVTKAMEIHGIGACVLTDTAGFDDEGTLGEMRVKQTFKATEQTDIGILVCTESSIEDNKKWGSLLEEKTIPYIIVLNKADMITDTNKVLKNIEDVFNKKAVLTSAVNREGIKELLSVLSDIVKENSNESNTDITGNLVKEGDTVLLIMPQDIQAPKGRLILPQVQTIRELLDKKCLVLSCTTDNMKDMLNIMKSAPKLIITDSQVFKTVYSQKPKESNITSFSVLFAKMKGDIGYFVNGAYSISNLTENSHVLIAEACTHAPLTEDIGREKIPAMLRKKFGGNIMIDIVSGADFPDDLSNYDLIIHCGGCMFNRKHMASRVAKAKSQSVPMTNYGVTIAFLQGILDKIEY